MGRNKKFKATITDSMFYEDLIWMSYRYCIGRKTIAAHSHAGNIARYCYNDINDERKIFMAKDIRQEINDVIRWRNNVQVNLYREDLDDDALSMIIYRLLEKYDKELPDGFDFESIQFDIDNDGVHMNGFTGEKSFESFASQFNDLIPWIKLANALDVKHHRVITTVYEGEKIEHECFCYPSLDYSGKHIDMRWVDVNSYLKNPSVERYIDEQYITEISEAYE